MLMERKKLNKRSKKRYDENMGRNNNNNYRKLEKPEMEMKQ